MKNRNLIFAAGALAFTCLGIIIGFFISNVINKPAISSTPTIDRASIQATSAAQVWFGVTQTQQALITPSPTITQTPSFTSTPSQTPTATEPPLYSKKGNGFYLVNKDIAPGVWKSDGTGDGCYWSTTTATKDIIDNHFGMAGGTAYISPTAFQVEFNNCGIWTYIQAP